MISGIKPPPISNGAPGARGATPGGRLIEYDKYIQAQLSKTRGHVRSVDFATQLMVWLVGGLLFLLAAALIDHWVISGGLNTWARFAAFALFVGAGLYYFASHLLPLLLRPINTVYAAYTIEQSKPTLKNSLINLLMFRQHREAVPDAVYEAIEQQAATRLAQTPLDTAVDRSKLIRVGYVLLAVVLVFALYKIVSPKDPFQTVERVLMPWSDISAPTRIIISDVSPGNAQALRGQPLKISAQVRGAAADDKVLLYYSSADGQTVDRPIEMFVPSNDYRYTCSIPAGEQGVQQDLEYRITAGDAATRRYKVHVVAAPTIVVDRLEYQYPEYTGLVAQQALHQGDIKAIEGTRVTIHALANQPIRDVSIDYDCDNTRDQPMTFKGSQASLAIPLTLENGSATHASYQVLFTNSSGHSNWQPVRYPIEILPDLAPEIQFLAPSDDQLELPLNGSVELELSAIDPDFALRKVAVVAAHSGQRAEKVLLNEVSRGRFGRKFRFEPGKMRLKPGDVLEYWAYAEDNKQPAANHSETHKRRIRLLAPVPPRQDQLASADKRPRDPEQAQNPEREQAAGKRDQGRTQENPGAGERNHDGAPQPNEAKQDPAQGADPRNNTGEKNKDDAAQGANHQQEAQNDQQESVSNKGDQDGDAIERILKHREEQQKQEKGDDTKSGSSEGPQAGGEQQQGSGTDEQDQNRNEQQNSDHNPSPQNSGQQSGPGDQRSGPQQGQGAGDQQGQTGESQNSQGAKSGDPAQQRSNNGENQSSTGQSAAQRGNSGQKTRGGDKQTGQQGSQHDGDGQQSGTAQPATDQRSGSQQARQRSKEQGTSKQGGQSSGSPQANGAQGDDQTKCEAAEQGQRKQQNDPSKSGERKDSQESGEQNQGEKTNATDKGGQSPGQQPDSDNHQGQQPQPNPGDRGVPDKSQKAPAGSQSGSESKEQTGGNQGDKHTPEDQRGVCKNCGGKGCEHCEGKAGSQGAQGQSGAGKSGQDKAGSPEAMKANRDRPKSDRPSQQNDTDKTDRPASASQSPHQSDSEGQQQGEQSGGGDKGGGQKAQSEGTGSAGEHSPADEGASSSQDSGSGETAGRSGDKQQGSSGGKPGEKSGPGQTSRENQNGSQPRPGQRSGGSASSNRSGGGVGPNAGRPGDEKEEVAGDDHAPQPPKTPDNAEKANLEYARKATDLAIEHLKDQLRKEKPDQDLLNKLGWSREDLADFLRRWQQMQRSAKRDGAEGEAARKELDDTLRSLGLRPQTARRRADTGEGDRQHRIVESRRTSPPAEYAEQYQAYTQGTARGSR